MVRGPYKKPRPALPKRCLDCGKCFLAIRSTRKFCSSLCRHRAAVPLHPPLPKKRCERCSKSFQSKLKKARFCSSKCGFREWTDNNRAKYNKKMRELNYKTRVRTPWTLLIASAKLRARQKGFPFDLTREWGEKRWTGHCEVSGLPFSIVEKAPRTLFSPTLDRIVPSGGYTQNNSRFVLWGVNAFKQNGTDADMFLIAEAITLKTKDVR